MEAESLFLILRPYNASYRLFLWHHQITVENIHRKVLYLEYKNNIDGGKMTIETVTLKTDMAVRSHNYDTKASLISESEAHIKDQFTKNGIDPDGQAMKVLAGLKGSSTTKTASPEEGGNELTIEFNKLARGGDRIGKLSSEQTLLYFKTVMDSLKPGEPVGVAVDQMLKIADRLVFTEKETVPVYTLIDKYASNCDERIKLTDKFIDILLEVKSKTKNPFPYYDTRVQKAQKAFKKEMESLKQQN